MFKLRVFALAAFLPLAAASENISWRPEVTRAIEEMCVKHQGSLDRPVAVFDWDNTMAKHDISDAVFHEMLAKDMIFAPPKDDLQRVNAFFLPEAISAVKKSCERFERHHKIGYLLAGWFYKTSGAKAKACRQEFLNFYHNEQTAEGKPAFDQSPGAFNRRTIKPSYLWVTQLLSGMTRDDVHALTNEVLDERTTPEAKARRTQKIDDFVVPSFLEIYDQMAKLVDKLIQHGFEVWIVSASQQYVVEAFAARLDQKLQGRFFAQKGRNYLETEIGRNNLHVIGVQVLSEQGDKARETLAQLGIRHDSHEPVLINKARGCGYHGENQIITYIEGKPCFIDMGIFEGDGRIPHKRPVFAAGDANTDVAMLQTASALSLVINRNYEELMCNAYQGNALGEKKWVIQPMFIDACPKREQGYQCRYTNERGDPLEALVEDSVFVASGRGQPDLDCHR